MQIKIIKQMSKRQDFFKGSKFIKPGATGTSVHSKKSNFKQGGSRQGTVHKLKTQQIRIG